MSQVPPEEERFMVNVETLSDAVSSLVIKASNKGFNVVSPDVVEIAKYFLLNLGGAVLIDSFIEKTNNHWEKIRMKERKFFLDNTDTMFGELPVSHVGAFKSLFQYTDVNGNTIVEKDDEEDLWELFKSLVKISIKYIHRRRQPYSYRTKQDVINSYRTQFMPYIDVPHLSRLWDIKIDYPLDDTIVPQVVTTQH